jgi:hypothetical protein
MRIGAPMATWARGGGSSDSAASILSLRPSLRSCAPASSPAPTRPWTAVRHPVRVITVNTCDRFSSLICVVRLCGRMILWRMSGASPSSQAFLLNRIHVVRSHRIDPGVSAVARAISVHEEGCENSSVGNPTSRAGGRRRICASAATPCLSFCRCRGSSRFVPFRSARKLRRPHRLRFGYADDGVRHGHEQKPRRRAAVGRSWGNGDMGQKKGGGSSDRSHRRKG